MSNFTQNTLRMLIREEFESMSAFAKHCGVNQSLVWRDCNGRQINDKRLSAYIGSLGGEGRARLIRARLRDILPPELESMVQVETPPSAREEGSGMAFMAAGTREALERLAGEMLRDPELHDWILQLITRICPSPARRTCD